MMQKFKFHLQNYFKIDVPIPAIFFAIIYFLMTFLWSFILVGYIGPEEIHSAMEGEQERFSLSIRLYMLSYEFILVPLYIKRFLDMGWQKIHIEIGILGLLLAPVLTMVLSDGGYISMIPVLAFLRILALCLTLVLFFMPSKKSKI
jgi:hypothetical protein